MNITLNSTPSYKKEFIQSRGKAAGFIKVSEWLFLVANFSCKVKYIHHILKCVDLLGLLNDQQTSSTYILKLELDLLSNKESIQALILPCIFKGGLLAFPGPQYAKAMALINVIPL